MKKYLLSLIPIAVNVLLLAAVLYVSLGFLLVPNAAAYRYKELEISSCINKKNLEEFSKNRFTPDIRGVPMWIAQPALSIYNSAGRLLFVTMFTNLTIAMILPFILLRRTQKARFFQRIRMAGIIFTVINASLLAAMLVVSSPFSTAPSRIWDRYEEMKASGCINEETLQKRLSLPLNDEQAHLDPIPRGVVVDEETLITWITYPAFYAANLALKVLFTAVAINLSIGMIFFIIGIVRQFLPRKNQGEALENFSSSPPPLPEANNSSNQ